MNRSVVKILAFVLVATLCMTGCSSPKPDFSSNAAVPEQNMPTFNQEQTFPNPSVDDTAMDVPNVPDVSNTQQITQQVCENLSIDAEVTIPDKNQYSTYTLKMVDSDPDRLFGIFCPEGYGSYTLDDRSSLRYFESSGKKLVVRKDSISYSAYNIDWGENPMQDVKTLMYYYTQEHSQAEPHDLSFTTVAEMEHFCNNIFNQLGIAFEPKLERCATLSGQEILDFQKEVSSNSRYTELGTPPKVTEANDTCYLEFSFTYDGLPLLGSEEPSVASAVSMLPTFPATATMMINADGLQNCDVYFPCVVESISEPQTVLTLEEAIATLKNKYDTEILFDSQTITDVWMEYVPMRQETSIVLTPYWCFAQIDKSEVDKSGYRGNADRFNAITGKDMAYGG